MQKEVRLKFKYVDCLLKVFEDNSARRKVIAKGRRLGFTYNAAQFMIEFMLSGNKMCLWGDTIAGNIDRYMERYFRPKLMMLPKKLWNWDKKERKLTVGNSVADFRSADRPENWEGFGYDLIILNEAGIILKNRYLWENAVRPMLLDNPESICIIGGTPKGKNLFYDLYRNGLEGRPNWKAWQFSTYDNPFISKQEVDELILEMPENIVRQEIYGEFLDIAEDVLIPYDLIKECMNRPIPKERTTIEVWGLDVARTRDRSVLAKRNGYWVYEVKEIHHSQDLMELVSYVNGQYKHSKVKPIAIFIDVTGMGWGVYDRMMQLGLPVFAADTGMNSMVEKVKNKRAEMYFNLLEAMKKELKLPDDKRILKELSYVPFKYDDRGNIILWKKDKIRREIGYSPDFADAIALTYYEEVHDVGWGFSRNADIPEFIANY